MDRYYERAQHHKRTVEETLRRKQATQIQLQELEQLKERLALVKESDESALKLIEEGLGARGTTQKPHTIELGGEKVKTFRTAEGLELWVGRNREENMELTFRQARGNDLWMHVQGKPGAHVVIRLNQGKSASLESLLDAAQLVLYYSEAKSWGKTEVDYTFRKYVKRIRDSQEVSYTNNKTLIVQFDSERFQRLMERGA
jgi:predicted ribosome quality control (RQC) complex YloA/Tae2 family protein